MRVPFAQAGKNTNTHTHIDRLKLMFDMVALNCMYDGCILDVIHTILI